MTMTMTFLAVKKMDNNSKYVLLEISMKHFPFSHVLQYHFNNNCSNGCLAKIRFKY